MSAARLPPGALEALRAVFARHPEIAEVVLFGSRAKGTERPESDVDLGVRGMASERAIEALADELDELPLPFLFDVKAIETIKNAALAERVRRVGMVIYERGGRRARSAGRRAGALRQIVRIASRSSSMR